MNRNGGRWKGAPMVLQPEETGRATSVTGAGHARQVRLAVVLVLVRHPGAQSLDGGGDLSADERPSTLQCPPAAPVLPRAAGPLPDVPAELVELVRKPGPALGNLGAGTLDLGPEPRDGHQGRSVGT